MSEALSGRDAVTEGVKDILVAYFELKPSRFTEDATLFDSLELDSLEFTGLVLHCEAKFNVNITLDLDEKFRPNWGQPELRTVGHLIDMIHILLTRPEIKKPWEMVRAVREASRGIGSPRPTSPASKWKAMTNPSLFRCAMGTRRNQFAGLRPRACAL